MIPTRCVHPAPAVVHNAAGEPVRLVCGCGREWRVLPVEWAITVTTAADVASIGAQP